MLIKITDTVSTITEIENKLLFDEHIRNLSKQFVIMRLQ